MSATAADTLRELEAVPVSSPVAYGVSVRGEHALGAAGGARTDGVFRVASVTKPFVAALVLTLVQDGLLSLDAPVVGYLPELAIDRSATLRHLLSHQAGLEHEWSTPLADFGEGDDALDRLARGEPVRAPVEPRRFFSYSSAGFYTAAATVQRVSGVTFEAALQGRILDPLGLEHTSFEGESARPYPRARRGGGGLFSRAADLLVFADHLLGGPGPLTAESRAELATPQIAAPEGWYGLGIGIHELRGRRILEHGGSVPGFRSLLACVPDAGVAFVGLSNADEGRRAIDALRDRAFEVACDLPPEPPAAAPLDAAGVAALAGTYDTRTFAVRLAPADGGVAVEIFDTDETVSALAVPVAGGAFRVAEGGEEGLLVEPLEDGLIRVGGMVARRAG
jgi:CubicO group peptidase (beta-lactamase class C family)